MAGRKDNTDKTYLGDGAYARYTEYGVWLAANHHNNEVVFIEWNGMVMLNEFIKAQKLRNNDKK